MTDAPYASLVIILKRPLLNQGKQRLAASLGAEQALAVAQHLLGCVIEDANNWPGIVILSPASATDHHWASKLLSRPAIIIPQSEGNLGTRIQFIDQQLAALNIHQTLYIGSDAPCITLELLLQADAALQQADVVLSHALDGGVTLMANREPWPELRALPWSSAQFAVELTAICRAAGYTLQAVSASYDVDTEDDLNFAYVDLQNDRRPSRRALLTLIEDIQH
jgi:glycosyltransferase A (GT-A) superfamily protein (DUF2064 family)